MRAWIVVAVAVLPFMAGCSADEAPMEPTPSPEAGSEGDENETLPMMDAFANVTWSSHAPAPTPRTEVAVAARGEIIFVIGGFDGNGLPSRVVEAYNINNDQWTTINSYPLPIHHTAAVADENYIYVFGGYTTPQPFTPTDLAFRLDASAGTWTPIERLPAARGAHAVAALGEVFFIVGGVGVNQQLVPAVLTYNPATDGYGAASDLPTPRDHLAAAGHGGLVYAIGGRQQSLATNTGLVEVLDPNAGSWSTIPQMPTPRGGITALTWRDHVVVFGGEESAGTIAAVDAYDPGTGDWRQLPDLPTPRHGLGSAVLNDRAYVMLGGPQPGLTESGAVESLGDP